MTQQPILRLNRTLGESTHSGWVAAGEKLR
jgi:hypothetical protein